MPDNREFKIKITTTADNSGATSAAAGLGDLDKATGKASESAKLFEGHTGEVRRATRELAHEFPLAAEALRLLADPVTGAITGAIIGFGLAKKALDEWNAAMDETAKKNAEATFAEAITAVKDAMEKGAEAAAQYNEKLANAFDPQEQFAQALKDTVAALHEVAEAEQQIADAAFGLDNDKLKAQLDQGLLSQEQYFIKLGELEKQHEVEKLARQKAAEDAELDAMRSGAEHMQQEQPKLDAAARSARSKATGADEKRASDEAMLKVLQGRKEANAKAVADAEAKINEHGGVGAVEDRAKNDPRSWERKYSDSLLSAFHAAIGTQNRDLTDEQAITGRLPREKSGAAAADRAATLAESRSEKNSDRLADAIEKFNAKADEYDRKDFAAEVIAGINAQRIDYKTAGKLGDLGLDPGQAQRAGAGGQVVQDMTRGSADLQQYHSTIAAAAGQAVTETTKISAALSKLATAITTGQGNVAKQIDDITRQLEILNSRSNSGSSGISGH